MSSSPPVAVFPPSAVRSHIEADAHDWLVFEESLHNGRPVYTPDPRSLDMERLRNARWFCGHEAGVYFCIAHRDLVGRVLFGEACFHTVTKRAMQVAFEAAGVPVLPKTPVETARANGPIDYPVVAKPNFGFASTLVQTIRSDDELGAYLQTAHQRLSRSIVAGYKQTYFPNAPDAFDQILLEPFIEDARLLSTAFIVTEGRVLRAFPVQGMKHDQTALTDFRWSAFSYPPPDWESLRAPLLSILQRLAEYFALERGVFESELLVTDTGDLFVLEFSPRLISGSIPDLIRHATGVDLYEASFRLFLNDAMDIPADAPAAPHVLVRTPESATEAPVEGTLVQRLPVQWSGDVRMVDRVYAVTP